jgi:molecular chaperone GrpE
VRERAPEVEEAQVEGAEPEEAAAMVEQLQAELDEAIASRKRALADFANYQRRAAENEDRAVLSGAAQVVRSLLGALDQFDLAVEQDTEQLTVGQLLDGVRIVRDELIKALEGQGVERIQPAVGEEFDPNRHEAVLRQAAEGIEANEIVSVLRPGYTMGAFVLRPAKVIVAAPPEESD